MHILVQTAETEHLVIVLDALAVEELLRLLQGAVHLGDLIILGLEAEYVGDPTVVTAKDEDLGVV